ncbi:MAG: 16S rRNA (uracil(1498)-N(3))-methyltransferase [Cyanobacteria bacterium J06648_11]
MGLPETPAQLKRLPRLALPTGSLQGLTPSASLALTKDQIHYLQRVRRLRSGDEFLAFDGSGALWQLQWQTGGALAIAALIPIPRELPAPVTLTMSIPKNGFDEVVRQATELGVMRIEPILTARTIVQPSPRKVERWRAIAREAAEQCERVFIPEITCPTPWAERVTLSAGAHFIAVARAEAPPLARAIATRECQTDPLAIAIGPEGGWTAAEVALAEQSGWRTVSLGARVLRAVTAATFALGVAANGLEDSSRSPQTALSEDKPHKS